MSYIPRGLGVEVRRAAQRFPAIIVTGPQRAGKTTLLQHLLPDARYRLLEDPDVVARIRSDPRAFLEDRLSALRPGVQAGDLDRLLTLIER